MATAEIPKTDRDYILKQLIEFTQYVYDQQTNTLKQDETSSEKPSDDAYGKWTPE